MLFVIILNYYLGLKLGYRSKNRNYILIFGVAANLLLLFIFKYLDFMVTNINVVFQAINVPSLPQPNIILPIGISFYIFQAMSYIIDVSRGQVQTQRSLFKFALYISLFPQLIAGPIVRYASIANDLDNRKLDYNHVYEGLTRFCTGLAKKVFLADSMGYIADTIFNSPVETIPVFWAWLGAITYSLQIYYDFSGYSDMAIGMGRMFNFHFPENFNFPYAAKSIQDFWRRWHMSLTTWLRDYLYIPLGGNRCSQICHYRNIIIVLVACGVWHGAAWSFFIWGLYNGLGLIIERLLQKRGNPDKREGESIQKIFKRLITLLFIIVGWVIFRSDTLDYALNYLKIMFMGNPLFDFYSFSPGWDNCVTISNAIFLILAVIISQPIEFLMLKNLQNRVVGQLYILFLFIITYAFAMTSTYSPFLYFRF